MFVHCNGVARTPNQSKGTNKMKQQKMLRLVESGLLLATATVLSMIKVLDLPYGGSITAFSALPLLVY